MRLPATPTTAFLLLATTAAAQETVVLEANNPPVWGDATLVEEVRIGTLDGDERYALGLVVGITETADGTVWVADRMLGAIRRYNADGEYLDEIGGRGDGPGEFSYLTDIRTTPSGEVAVWDPMGRRITYFRSDGSLARDVTVEVGGAFGIHQPFEVDADGTAYVAWLTDRWFWIRVDPKGAVMDTLWYPGPERDGMIKTMSVVSPAGHLVTGRNDEFSFSWPLRDGRTMTVERDVDVAEYHPDERAEAQAREELFSERRGDDPIRIPREKPVWSEFAVSADGRIWVRRHVRGVEVEEGATAREVREQFDNPVIGWREPVVYDVVDPTGVFLGTIRIPNGTWAMNTDKVSVVLARDDSFWVVERGEFREEYLVKYRIVSHAP